MARDEFHPDAHPQATDITGSRDYGEWGQCTFDEARSTGERCTQPAKGPHGKCRFHGGSEDAGAPEGNQNATGNSGGSAPEGNTNAVTHGAYADHNSYYQDILGDTMQQFVDDVFADYLQEYRNLHGEPPLGIESELFRISVTHAKDIGLDRWADEKPDELDSGHPLVDKEVSMKEVGDRIVEERKYRESVVQSAQKRLSTDRRQWLKDLGLLDDPESQKAEAVGDLASIIEDES